MALAEFTKLRILEESTYGVTPASAMREMAVSNINPVPTRDVSPPGVYTGDRRNYAGRILRKGSAWTVETQLIYENTIELWEGIAVNDRDAAATTNTGTTISGTGATGAIDDSGNGFGSFVKGDWVYLSGAIGTNTPGWYGPVSAAAAGSITVPAAQLADFAAGSSVTVTTRQLKDGAVKHSYSMEWENTDAELTNQFEAVTGVVPVSVALEWAQGGYVSENWTLMGKFPAYNSASVGTGAATGAVAGQAMNAVDDIGNLWIANGTTGIGAATTLIVNSIGMTLQNTVQGVYGVGSSGPSAIDIGQMIGSQVRANIRFDNTARTAVAELLEAHTTMALAWEVTDPDGDSMLFFFPSVKPDTGQVNIGAAGSVVNVDTTFSLHDPAKDPDSFYNASAFGYQWSVFYRAAP